VEGPTDNPEINALRERQRRNFLTTTFSFAGRADANRRRRVGSDAKRQQQRVLPGQRDQLVQLEHDEKQNQFLEFTRNLIQLRKDHPVFRGQNFSRAGGFAASEIQGVMWFNPGGCEMSDDEWASPFVRCLGMLLSGDTMDVFNFQGEPIRDDTFLLLIKRAL